DEADDNPPEESGRSHRDRKSPADIQDGVLDAREDRRDKDPEYEPEPRAFGHAAAAFVTLRVDESDREHPDQDADEHQRQVLWPDIGRSVHVRIPRELAGEQRAVHEEAVDTVSDSCGHGSEGKTAVIHGALLLL